MNLFHKVSREEFVKSLEVYIKLNKKKISDKNAQIIIKDSLDYFDNNFKMPHRSTEYSAGYDIYLPVQVPKHASVSMIPTGLKVEIDEDMFLSVHPRSSTSINDNYMISNTTGIIDCDYYNNPANEGHILLNLRSFYDVDRVKEFYTTGNRLVQGLFLKYYTTDDDDLVKVYSSRHGGFGSTGE